MILLFPTKHNMGQEYPDPAVVPEGYLPSEGYAPLPQEAPQPPMPVVPLPPPPAVLQAPPQTEMYVPPPQTEAYAPQPQTEAYAPPPQTEAYVPPPQTEMYVPPPQTEAYARQIQGEVYMPPSSMPSAVVPEIQSQDSMASGPYPSPTAPTIEVMPTLSDMPARGQEVRVKGLVGNELLNGKPGIVIGYRSDGAVLVNIPTANLLSAPIDPSNLSWGETFNVPESISNFMDPMLPVRTFEGRDIVRVRAEKVRFSNEDMCCSPTSVTNVAMYKMLLWSFANFIFSCFSLTMAFLSIFLMPFTAGYSCMLNRWMAHRHLHMLLIAHPPSVELVLSHPTAIIKNGNLVSYFCAGHTWRCLCYCLFLAFPLAVVSVALAMFSLPLGIVGSIFVCSPFLRIANGIIRATLWIERSTAVCFLSQPVCDVNEVVANLEKNGNGPRTTTRLAANEEATPTERSGLVEASAYARECHEGEAPPLFGDGATPPNPGTGEHSMWLSKRDRNQEESIAIEKFAASFYKTFGRFPRLQDIQVQPPREPGKGPRHFITLADNVDDADRLKLVKSYKQAFSNMYVHIVDAEERQRQQGTDYSAMYC